ncbi:alpha/beta fold hydrolase [Alcaligenaceae bacterium]|nr:alpha/beta fold hydrolase [Alcaligenaceae bacterium]
MLHAVENIKQSSAASWQWLLRVRNALPGQPNFVFFPHAGATPLSISRIAAVLPGTVGVAVAVLPRGGDLDDGTPPLRATDAAQCVARGLMATAPSRLVLVGNSYGALLAYETAWCLTHDGAPIERLIVSGFRSPALPLADIPLHRLPAAQLRAELSARFGTPSDAGAAEGELAEHALRADLQACDTYRHRHDERLPVPLDVLHLTNDWSVSMTELQAWQSVTRFPMRLTPCASGHFPWTGNPEAIARTLLGLVKTDQRGHVIEQCSQNSNTAG